MGRIADEVSNDPLRPNHSLMRSQRLSSPQSPLQTDATAIALPNQVPGPAPSSLVHQV